MFRHLLITCVAVVTLSGCFSSVVRATGPAGTKHSEAGASLFWGITTPVHGATECQYGLKEVELYRPWYSGLVELITLGIVTPITAQWTCLAAPPGTPSSVHPPLPAPPPSGY